MFRHRTSRAQLLFLLALAGLTACQDTDNSPVGPEPQFAQGDNGNWTVNSLADPGDGVCNDTECTLREAISAAAPGGNIQFATALAGDIKLTSGALFQGKDLTVDGAGRIAVDAQGSSEVITVVNNSGQTRLAGLTFKNGHSTTSGGGVVVFGGTLTLDHVTISGNTSDTRGGGLALQGADVTILNSTLAENSAGTDGGAIAVLRDLAGGSTQLTLINSTVTGNTAQQGGGLANAGTLTVIASTISDNEGTGVNSSSGGIYNDEDATATIVRSTISGNRALEGDMSAGGVLTFGDVELRSSTVTRNFGPFRETGGIQVWVAGVVTMANSIIAGNEAEDGPSDCDRINGGTITSLGYNLSTLSCALGSTDAAINPAQAFTEVLEQDLKDNGGPTTTHALIARGRAMDAGYCPGESADQRDFARPVDVANISNARDACDIGAYELQGPVAIVADLMISQTVNKTSVKQGDLLTYSIRVQNLGPETAPKVVVTDLLPTGATFVEVRKNKGTVTAPPKGETGTVTWSVGELLDQANEVATITVTVLVKGKTSITNSASVTGDVADPNQANNSAAITVSVAAGSTKPPKK